MTSIPVWITLFNEEDHYRHSLSHWSDTVPQRGPQYQQALQVRKTHGKCHVPPHFSRRNFVFELFVQNQTVHLKTKWNESSKAVVKPFKNIFEEIARAGPRNCYFRPWYVRGPHHLRPTLVDSFVSSRKLPWTSVIWSLSCQQKSSGSSPAPPKVTKSSTWHLNSSRLHSKLYDEIQAGFSLGTNFPTQIRCSLWGPHIWRYHEIAVPGTSCRDPFGNVFKKLYNRFWRFLTIAAQHFHLAIT